jgi:hypothetical protein
MDSRNSIVLTQKQIEDIATANRRLDTGMNDFYDIQSRFFADMAQFFGDAAQSPRILQSDVTAPLSITEVGVLKGFSKSFQELGANPFKSDNNSDATMEQRIVDVIAQMNSPEVKATLEKIKNLKSDFSAFSAFLNRFNNDAMVAAHNESYQVLVAQGLKNNLIKPVQHVPRFELHFREVLKNLAESTGLKMDTFDEQILPEIQEKNITDLDAYARQKVPAELVERFKTTVEFSKLYAAMKAYSDECNKAVNPSRDEAISKFVDPVVRDLAASLAAGLQEAARVAKTPAIADRLNALRVSMDSTANNAHKVQIAANMYLDAYIDERTKENLKTVKKPYLVTLEATIKDALKVPSEANMKPEEVILKQMSLLPATRKRMLEHLYDRALREGIANDDKTVFKNAIKAVVRMGNEVIKEWNEMAKREFKQGEVLTLPLNEVDRAGTEIDRISEKAIQVMQSSLVKHEIRTDIVNHNYQAVMIDFIKTGDKGKLNNSQKSFLNELVEFLGEKNNYKDAQEQFIKSYLQIYVMERDKSSILMGGGTTKGDLLKYLENAIIDFKKVAGTPIEPAHAEVSLLQMVEPGSKGAKALSGFLFEMAIDAFNSKKEMRFVNCLKAIERMGTVKEWDELAAKYKLPELILAGNKTLGGEMKEKNIVLFYKSLQGKKLAYSKETSAPQSPSASSSFDYNKVKSSAQLMTQFGVNSPSHSSTKTSSPGEVKGNDSPPPSPLSKH